MPKTPPPKPPEAPKKPQKQAKSRRLAEALRANLARRKAQQRIRAGGRESDKQG